MAEMNIIDSKNTEFYNNLLRKKLYIMKVCHIMSDIHLCIMGLLKSDQNIPFIFHSTCLWTHLVLLHRSGPE